MRRNLSIRSLSVFFTFNPVHRIYLTVLLTLILGESGRIYAQNPCTPGGCKGPNLVQNGDFEAESPVPGNPLVGYTSQLGYITCPPANSLALWGRITVLKDPNICYFNWSGNDHTYGNGKGNMLVVDFPAQNPDGSTNPMDIWATTVTVDPGETYCFGGWYKNLNVGINVSKPRFRYYVDGTEIGFTQALPNDGQWYYYGYNYTVPSGVTSLTIAIKNGKWGGGGNDLAIDDIEFRKVGSGPNPPVANNDQVIVQANSSSYPINVLGNDNGNNSGFTPGFSNMSLTSHPPAAEGTVSVMPSGQVSFVPAQGFVGTAMFKYEICHPSGCCSEAVVTVSVDQVLPARIGNFEGEMIGEDAVLHWTALEENNILKYEVERSADLINFEVVGELKAGVENDNSGEYPYTFVDMQVLATGVSRMYYRLRMVDADGSVSTGNVIEVAVYVPNGFELRIYPNPIASGVMKVDIQSEGDDPVVIRLLDITGEVTFRQMLPGQEGHRVMKLDVQGYPAGLYLLSVTQGKNSALRRVVITH